MENLDEFQSYIASNTEGILVVDAGPGTGKTHTMVERYIKILSNPNIDSQDILLLTFTNNSTLDLKEQIYKHLIKNGIYKKPEYIKAMTFDAFCLSVIMDYPELVSDFFDFKYKLTHKLILSDNETINKYYFKGFFNKFIDNNRMNYGKWSVISSQYPLDIMNLIDKLMQNGIIPTKNGWFGENANNKLYGAYNSLYEKMIILNKPGPKGGNSEIMKVLLSCDTYITESIPLDDVSVEDDILMEAVNDDRSELFRFIHDVYYEFIMSNVMDNRLTFGLISIFALSLLYKNKSIREKNSFKYLMIDEFQDTNTSQLMISLMILSTPNLCVVGDWKQGIYSFRFVSIDNIIKFESKIVCLKEFLNRDLTRVQFQIPKKIIRKSLNINYRSSQYIINKAFECMYLPYTKKCSINKESIKNNIVMLSAGRKDIEDSTEIQYIKTESVDVELDAVVKCILEYIKSHRYKIKHGIKSRSAELKDIAIICRKTASCRTIMNKLDSIGIPYFLQSDADIMSTREGKLVLAWLRYVNDETDPWGYVPIMVDMNYSMVEILNIKNEPNNIPNAISEQRMKLYNKQHDIVDLLTFMFSFYRLNNQITQTIIVNLSKIHKDSMCTISDIIHIIEEDIRNGNMYHLEKQNSINAVTIMTMHKSKGLEFPIVIIPFMDRHVMPYHGGDREIFIFNDTVGIRCKKDIVNFDGHNKICDSWKTKIIKRACIDDHSEERRLMFVTMSRAKQYITLICGPNPSVFIENLSSGIYSNVPNIDMSFSLGNSPCTIDRPKLPRYTSHIRQINVCDLLNHETYNINITKTTSTTVGLWGSIRKITDMICQDKQIDLMNTEVLPFRDIINNIKDADDVLYEVDCYLPINELNITLHGVIHLLATFPDCVEIYDCKMDTDKVSQSECHLQLSIYFYATSFYYKKQCKIFLDYVSMGRLVELVPMTIEQISQYVSKKLKICD